MSEKVVKWMPSMYVTYFGILQGIFSKHGYILYAHDSVVKDFDLVAVPFHDDISTHEVVLDEVKSMIGLDKPTMENFRMTGMEAHGRMCYAIECGGGGYFDISFTPTLKDAINFIERQKKNDKDIKKLLSKVK